MNNPNMSLEQLEALKQAIDNTARHDQMIALLPDHLIPQVAALKRQQDEIAKALKAVDAAIEVQFTEQYFGTTTFQSDRFFTMVDNRIQELKDARQQAQINVQVQAQVQAQVQQIAAQQQMAAQAAQNPQQNTAMQEG